MAEDDGLLRNRITDESVDLMRRRIGFPNPTLRTAPSPNRGIYPVPTMRCAASRSASATTTRSIHAAGLCAGVRAGAGSSPPPPSRNRWGLIAIRTMDADEAKITSKALRGIQLFHSGGEEFLLCADHGGHHALSIALCEGGRRQAVPNSPAAR